MLVIATNNKWYVQIAKFFVPYITLLFFTQISNAASCSSPTTVCEWKEKIVGIKTPSMIASGIKLPKGFILTNRHVVEDHSYVLVRDSKGEISEAVPLFHNMPADLVILRPNGVLGDPPLLLGLTKVESQIIYVVAFDQGRKAPRVYRPSSFAHYPDTVAFPQARIHSDARALPGNSGGIVVDKNGLWVGVLASGDGKISEIIPAIHAQEVAQTIGEQHQENFIATGQAIRVCADTLYAANSITKNPPEAIVSKITRHCLLSKNKQLLDQAGQIFGRWWLFDESEMFLKNSESLDPNSPNTLMSLAVTYHLSRKTEKERLILKRYLEIDPTNAQALRLGAQVAGMLKDQLFADQVLTLMKAHNPEALPLANSFIRKAFEGQKP